MSRETTTTPTEVKKITIVPGRSIERFDSWDYTVWSVHMKNILYECKLLKYIDHHADIDNYLTDEDKQAIVEIQFTL